MGQLRDQMASDLVLRGLRPTTQEKYLRCAKALAAFHRRSPAELGAEEVRAFLLDLLVERGVTRSTYNVYRAALAFLYVHTLRRPDVVAAVPRPLYRRPSTRPVLTADEVARVLAHAPHSFARTAFALAYGCGLRISEVCKLRFEDVRGKDGLLVLRDAKGGCDRIAMLSQPMYRALQAHFRRCSLPGPWMFPARPQGPPGSGPAWADKPVDPRTLADWFRDAAKGADLRDRVTFHVLRHSCATALLEDGYRLNEIQAVLGHADLATTTRYTHVRPELIRRMRSPVDALLG